MYFSRGTNSRTVASFFKQEFFYQRVEPTSGIGEIIIFYNFYLSNRHNKFYSRIQQQFKFSLIYNLYFYFYFTSSIALIMLGVDFCFRSNLFYFRSSSILVDPPSATDFDNFFSLFCTMFSKRLSVLAYGEIPEVSRDCRCCVVGSPSLKSSHGDSRVKYFEQLEVNQKSIFL